MFDFFYLQSYGSGRSGTTDSEVNRSSFILHAKVYAMGEKYGIPSLKEAAIERFREDTHSICADDDLLKLWNWLLLSHQTVIVDCAT